MIKRLLSALAIAFLATVTSPPAAYADNCDIFINPEDCQNTGWTIGTIATVTGGVAVAMVALMAGQSQRTPTQPPPTQPTPLPPLPHLPRPPRQRRDENQDEDTDEVDGVSIRPVFDAPTVSVDQRGGEERAFAVRLEIHLDPGTQTVQEARRDPR
jgi:hypothetical protein